MFIVYEQDFEPTHCIDEITLHKTYDAAAREIKRRALHYKLTGKPNENYWIGIREVRRVSDVAR